MPIATLATLFDGARLFVPEVHEDDRGYFKETYSTEKYRALGLLDTFVQDSISFSTKHVIRGMHYDLRMSKLIQILRGKVFDVIVDIRKGSATYLKWQAFILTDANHHQLYVPPGFAQGFMALSDEVIFSYKHGSPYDPATEGSIRWDDPTLGIAWPLAGEPRISLKDRAAPLLSQTPFHPDAS